MRSTSPLVFVLFSALFVGALSGKPFVGYWASWRAEGNPAGCNIPPESIPADRYTHLIWSFATFNSSTGHIDPLPEDLIRRFVAIKHRNPSIKLLASFGGAGLSETEWHILVTNIHAVNYFVRQSVTWLRGYGLDGIDIDWEYPADSYPEEKPYVVPFFKALREAYDFESQNTGKPRLLLTSAAVAGAWELDGYQPEKLQHYVDFFNVMFYDFWGTWMPQTGPLAPLYGNVSLDLDIHTCTQDYLARNVSIHKLVFGFPNYAATWTVFGGPPVMYAPSNGTGGNPGSCYGGSGQISATELQRLLDSKVATPQWDDVSKTPYLSYQNQFVSYENTRSIDLKLDYLISKNFLGGMMWVVDPNTQVADQVWNRLKNAN